MAEVVQVGVGKVKRDLRMWRQNWFCIRCSEFFDAKVWCCPQCAHHWPEGQDECKNCRSFSANPPQPSMEDWSEELREENYEST